MYYVHRYTRSSSGVMCATCSRAAGSTLVSPWSNIVSQLPSPPHLRSLKLLSSHNSQCTIPSSAFRSSTSTSAPPFQRRTTPEYRRCRRRYRRESLHAAHPAHPRPPPSVARLGRYRSTTRHRPSRGKAGWRLPHVPLVVLGWVRQGFGCGVRRDGFDHGSCVRTVGC